VGRFSPSGSQYRYILTVQDELSKFLIAIPLEDQTSEQVARAFAGHIMLIYGVPQIILNRFIFKMEERLIFVFVAI